MLRVTLHGRWPNRTSNAKLLRTFEVLGQGPAKARSCQKRLIISLSNVLDLDPVRSATSAAVSCLYDAGWAFAMTLWSASY